MFVVIVEVSSSSVLESGDTSYSGVSAQKQGVLSSSNLSFCRVPRGSGQGTTSSLDVVRVSIYQVVFLKYVDLPVEARIRSRSAILPSTELVGTGYLAISKS